tara:strand:- start:757 stop:945 length:189 start_codon:yes stop_codon:yes gene_type:complete
MLGKIGSNFRCIYFFLLVSLLVIGQPLNINQVIGNIIGKKNTLRNIDFGNKGINIIPSGIIK